MRELFNITEKIGKARGIAGAGGGRGRSHERRY